jgi:hypothetical protein
LDDVSCERLARDLADTLSTLTRRQVTILLIDFATVADAVDKLKRQAPSGVAMFVLNDEPTAYHDVSFGLPDWRVKRLTQRTLRQHYAFLHEGLQNGQTQGPIRGRGKARWDRYIMENALGMAQLLDLVPFRLDQAGPYEAQLAIDVGHDQRHFALSLLIARATTLSPTFRIRSNVIEKPDQQFEAINPVMLADAIEEIVDQALGAHADPLASLLVLRDGRLCGREGEGIDRALERLTQRGLLVPGARVDLADLHKDTLKSIRLWEVDSSGRVDNPLEGTMIRLNRETVLLTATGAATLTQGTAEPLLLSGIGRCRTLEDAAAAAFAAAQLNWASPSVAQRLPQELKRTDEDLTARAAQEIRRLR